MKIFKVLFLFVCLSGFAQSKVGTINVDYILTVMPELKTVQTDLDTYGAQLDVDLNKKVDQYKALLEAYKVDESSLTVQQKQTRQQALIDAETDINKFRQNGGQLINIKQSDLMRPLYQKIGNSLEKLAKAQNFTQVLQITETVAYFDQNLDLTLAVISDLGITIPTGDTTKN